MPHARFVPMVATKGMHDVKDTPRALVKIGFDGRVHKVFKGHLARERFENEVRVLRHLEKRGCPFVPRLLESDPAQMKIVTTNCGRRVDQLNKERMAELYSEVEQYGVRHEDRYLRNVTYRTTDGRFCLIDFEFATIIDDPTAPPGPPPPPPDPAER